MTIYSLPFSLITTFFISYAFELLGRKLTIALSYFLTGIIYVIIPYTKPHFWFLAVMRCLIGVTMSAPIANPLINDYIRKDSRGKAIAINGLGGVCGEVMAMGVLLRLSKNMSYEKAFSITGIIIILFSAYFSIFIKNPNLLIIQKRVDKLNENKRSSKVFQAKDTDYVKFSQSVGNSTTF